MKSNPCEKPHEVVANRVRLLDACSNDLFEIASALKFVGNKDLAARIRHVAVDIKGARDDIDRAVAEELLDRVRAADASSKATFEAALAGIEMGRNENA